MAVATWARIPDPTTVLWIFLDFAGPLFPLGLFFAKLTIISTGSYLVLTTLFSCHTPSFTYLSRCPYMVFMIVEKVGDRRYVDLHVDLNLESVFLLAVGCGKGGM